MCVIIKRDPGIVIPEEKISSACKVNPHGYGFSIVDRGQIETIKVQKNGGNEEAEVLKLLKESKNQLAFLHLRYTTAGKTNEENCHPFTSFKGDNFEVQFMHNGTLGKFSKGVADDHSDTWHFNEEILKPLIRAFYEVDGAGVLLNPTVKTIISEFKGASAFMLYDNEGNHLAIENSSCKQFEGWWASNEYSFDRYHREVKTPEDYYGNYPDYRRSYYYYGQDYSKKEGSHQTTPPANVSRTLPVATAPKPTETAVSVATKAECKQVGYAVMQAKKQGIMPKKLTPPEDRLTFCEMAELSSLDDVMLMAEGDLYDLVEELPLAATTLLMDLIHELYVKRQEQKKTTDTSATVTQFKGAA